MRKGVADIEDMGEPDPTEISGKGVGLSANAAAKAWGIEPEERSIGSGTTVGFRQLRHIGTMGVSHTWHLGDSSEQPGAVCR